jgi:fatty acid desaturase
VTETFARKQFRERTYFASLGAIEWPTVALIAGCYGAWLVIGLYGWSVSAVATIGLMALPVALHSSLMHEASHGHPTRKGIANEFLVGLPLGLFWPYRRFKALHLRHHADERLTDPFDDPESYYRALWQYRELPVSMRAVLDFNNTMVGRILIGPALATIGFIIGEWRLLRTGDRGVQRAWLHHAAGLVIVLPVALFVFAMPFWAYLVAVYLGHSIITIRTFAEHQWSERPDGRTVIVEHSPFALLFLNNNLHLVHHKMPSVAWYRLPAMFRERREEWLRLNEGYAYRGYLDLFRAYAFRRKEEVVHPALRRVPEPGMAFRPRRRQTGADALGVGVPANPSKE